MRYVLAIASLVLAAVLLVLGIGQRTFLAGPSEISYPVELTAETSYAVVDGDELAKLPGQANVVVRGDQAFVATAMTRDVAGWVAPYSHAELTVDTKRGALLSALVAASTEAADGEDAAPVDPRGSDLWLEERAIDESGGGAEASTLRVPVSLASDQSVIIASDGEQPVSTDVRLVWVQARETPWAGPLLAGGALFAVVGAVLYLLAVDHDRRGLGPRRGRKGPLQGIRNTFSRGRRRAAAAQPEAPGSGSGPAAGGAAMRSRRVRRGIALPALGIAAAVGLSGCSASYWPNLSGEESAAETTTAAPAQSSAVAPVPVTEGQVSRIIADISEISGEADDELDADLLEARFTGDALEQRSANYTIRADMSDYGVVPPRITDETLGYTLVQSTESWPRTMLVTVASTSGSEDTAGEETDEGEADAADDDGAEAEDTTSSPSLALMLTQQTPHENYRVSRIVSLSGGISMPEAAPAEEGTALLANDIETLVLSPEDVAGAYAAVLAGGEDVDEAQYFDLATDTLLENYGKVRAEEAQKQSDDQDQTMQFSVEAKAGAESPVALSTGVGGAIVATTVIEEQIVDADGGRYKPQAKDAVTALSGLEGEQERLVQEVAHQMLFFVPSQADGAKIELLGVTSELVGVSNK